MSLLRHTPEADRRSLSPEDGDVDDNSNSAGDDEFPEEEGFLDDEDDDLSLHGLDDEPELDMPSPSRNSAAATMCIVCGERPAYSQGGRSYPTCGLTCAGRLENRASTSSGGQNHGGYAAAPTTPRVSRGDAVSPITSIFPTSSNLRAHRATAQSSHNRPTPLARSRSQHFNTVAPAIARSHSRHTTPPPLYTPSSPSGTSSRSGGYTPQRNSNQYSALPPIRTLSQRSGSGGYGVQRNLSQGGTISQNHGRGSRYSTLIDNPLPCVVCLVRFCPDSRFVTCGLRCAERLCRRGSANANMCNYCHRRPKFRGHNQCGDTCRIKARVACLLCKSRPKHKSFHLCGKICKQISLKYTPLLLEVPSYHATYEMVENKFKHAWKFPNLRQPTIKRIYKIIENKSFLQPYDRYKRRVRNEAFRYHGTTRTCNLGSRGNTRICGSSSCPLCSILKTSFKTSLANPGGAFGPGIYTSSASNKAYSYTGNGSGAMLLTKVVLGKVRYVSGWKEVMSCPPGYNSVVFDRLNGCLNETIIYSDDAIRPVFLIIF